MNTERQGEIYIALEVLLWGLFPVITILSLSGVVPLVSLAWSTLFAAVFFGVLIIIRNRWREMFRMQAMRDVLLGTFIIGIVFYCLYFWGLTMTSAGNAAIIALSEMFFSYVLFNAFLKEYIPRTHIVGSIFMIVGAGIVLTPNITEFQYGDLCILLAAMIAPIGNFFQRRARKEVSSETIMFVRSFLTAPILFCVAYLFGENLLDISNKQVFLFFAINGVLLLGLSKIFWLEGIHRINVAKANAMNSAAPLITLLFAWILLKDVPTLFQLTALVPIIIGAFFLGKNENPQKIQNS